MFMYVCVFNSARCRYIVCIEMNRNICMCCACIVLFLSCVSTISCPFIFITPYLLLYPSFLFHALPERKQVLAFSATFPRSLMHMLSSYMRDPQRVNMTAPASSSSPASAGNDRGALLLRGVKLFYKSFPHEKQSVREFSRKGQILVELLSGISFHQCMVFCNQRGR